MGATETTTEVVIADAGGLAVADDVIDEVVHGIAALQRDHGLRLAYDIGRLVVDRFYAGDMETFRARHAKDASLRKLAEHPELPISRSSLHRAVAVFEVVDRVGGIEACGQLGVSHVRSVLALPAPEQAKLLKRADEKAWTVKQLEEEARKKRSRRGGGRHPLPRFVKTLHALEKYADGDDELFGDLDAVDGLEPDEAQRLYRTVTGLKLRCAELQKKLEGRVPGFQPVD